MTISPPRDTDPMNVLGRARSAPSLSTDTPASDGAGRTDSGARPAAGPGRRRGRRNLAERAASFLERRVDRRGVLRRGAMAGTALAVAPATFALRPGSAYAAVCAPNALCNDGYTEFCCTITGANRCPPGTALGGWWKVDGSEFCGGGPRYYMDCNAGCGDPSHEPTDEPTDEPAGSACADRKSEGDHMTSAEQPGRGGPLASVKVLEFAGIGPASSPMRRTVCSQAAARPEVGGSAAGTPFPTSP